jgi:hypothetical protein
MGEVRSVFSILFRKREEKRPFGRSRHRWRIILK